MNSRLRVRPRRRLLAAALCLLGTLILFPATRVLGATEHLANQYVARGVSALSEGSAAAALEYFEAALELDSESAIGRLGSAVAQTRLGRRAEAERGFRQVSGRFPAIAALGQGICALSSGKVVTARSLFAEAEELELRPAELAQSAQAYCMALKGQHADAQILLAGILGADPGNYLALAVLAEGALSLGSPLDASATFREIVTLRDRHVVEIPKDLALLPPAVLAEGRSPIAGMGRIPPDPGDEEPGIRILTPLSGAEVTGRVPLVASLVGDERDLYVTFRVNDERVHGTDRRPYRVEWDAYDRLPGPYVITVVAQSGLLGEEVHRDEVVVHVTREGARIRGAAGPGEAEQALAVRMARALELRPSEDWIGSLRQRIEQQTNRDPAARQPTLPPEWRPAPVGDGNGPDIHPAAPRPAGAEDPVVATPNPTPVPTGVGGRPAVALLFDDGPHPVVTPALLEILREEEARATFFLVGVMAEQYPELARRASDAGHEIGNHTYDHVNLDALLPPEIQRQIVGNKVLLEAITGRAVTALRGPGEHCGPRAQLIANQSGLSIIPSTVNTWPLMALAPEEIIRQTVQQARDGATILLHNGKDKSIFCLRGIIRGLRDRGFEFLTVSEWRARYAVTPAPRNVGAASPVAGGGPTAATAAGEGR